MGIKNAEFNADFICVEMSLKKYVFKGIVQPLKRGVMGGINR
jgi:hypothetical protein